MKNGILIVDDDDDTAHVLTEYLRDEGYEAMAATTVRQGLEKFKAAKFSMLVSDYRLPDGTGVELCQKCRAIAPKLKIIMLTGVGATGYPQMKAASDLVLEKPLRPRDLLRHINLLF